MEHLEQMGEVVRRCLTAEEQLNNKCNSRFTGGRSDYLEIDNR